MEADVLLPSSMVSTSTVCISSVVGNVEGQSKVIKCDLGKGEGEDPEKRISFK